MTMRRTTLMTVILAAACLGTFAGCASTAIAVREQLGYAKREQLVNRVEDARDEQEDAKEQFATTLDQFKALTGYEGGNLESVYRKLDSAYKKSKASAADVSKRIDDVRAVGDAMFSEWEKELTQYSNPTFRTASEQQLRDTRTRYTDLVAAMEKAESRMDPVLTLFADQVLFLKHNLNARAIASLDTTVLELQGEIDRLIAEMNTSIDEADAFIAELAADKAG